jgi:hypothetical protein
MLLLLLGEPHEPQQMPAAQLLLLPRPLLLAWQQQQRVRQQQHAPYPCLRGPCCATALAGSL